ncbi:MAG TPA: chromosomal replication initiator protein DnaA [Opitutales bacterium]|jgi:chromosomal replication initiator protein|nr:chromosomal replication initiator protein DnaA [Opitutales bacterium]
MSLKTLPQSLWAALQSDFQTLFPSEVYKAWFEPIVCLAEDAHSIELGLPSDFALIWVQENYRDLLQRRLNQTAGHAIELSMKVAPNAAAAALAPVSRLTEVMPARARLRNVATDEGLPLNARYTFENFVVGPGNQLAHAACIAIANAPARAYNPVFLYGETGLGKTHLMHAVAHCIIQMNPNARVAYISTEKFTNEYIRAIQDNSVTRFRQRYRSVDALLIDDIHFLTGKERIQEEFFHTFNELFESGRQILLSSDRPASEIAKLEARLVSRFQWGMMADIQAPDLETRVAILSSKVKNLDLDLPTDVIQFLAERVTRNVRRMEGALTRVAAVARFMKTPVDVPTVERLLQDLLNEEAQNTVTMEKIQNVVTKYYELRGGDLLSRRRPQNIAFPRQVAMYLCRMFTSHSLQEIGDAFGGRDHGTVIHACKTVENMMEQDASAKRTVEVISKQLGQRI